MEEGEKEKTDNATGVMSDAMGEKTESAMMERAEVANVDTITKEDSILASTMEIVQEIGTQNLEKEWKTDTQFLDDEDVLATCDYIVAKHNEKKEKVTHKKKVDEGEGSAFKTDVTKQNDTTQSSMPSYSLGLTQEFGENYGLDSLKEPEVAETEKKTDGISMAKDVVGEDMNREAEAHKDGLKIKINIKKGNTILVEKDNKEAETKKVVEVEAEKREIRVASLICSPYMNRKVDPYSLVTKDEGLVANWIIGKQGNRMEEVFKTASGEATQRMEFESLEPSSRILPKIINIWAYILNDEENFRNKSSPHRLFCKTFTVEESMIFVQMKQKERKEALTARLKVVMKNEEEMPSLKDIDMIFFPIQHSTHFYVIVFNLKNPSLVILDNSATSMIIEDRYGDFPTTLVRVNRYRLKWRTVDENADGGVFAMRHMETFKGETVSKYDCGFQKESGAQEVQINKLRRKYLAKILLSDHNSLRSKVIEEATEFSKKKMKFTKKMIQDINIIA